MSAKYLAYIVLFAGAALSPIGGANAQPLSPGEALSVGSRTTDGGQRFISGTIDLIRERASVSGFSDEDTPGAKRERPLRGVIGLSGPLGVILDYSSGLPRMRGLAFSPNDLVRIEASGSIDQDLDNVGGQISVHFNF